MEQSADHSGGVPAPQGVTDHPIAGGHFRTSQVLPANLRSGQQRARSTRILMFALAGVAVALIAVGIAAPQLTYASDVNEYDALMAESETVATRVAQGKTDLAAAELLLGKQYEEAAGVAGRLTELATYGPDVIAPENTAVFAHTATEILAELPQTQPPMSPRALAALEATLGADPSRRPGSWLIVTPGQMGELARLQREAPEAIDASTTISRAALDDARRQLVAQRTEVEEFAGDVAERAAQSTHLRSTVGAGYAAVDAVVTGVPAHVADMIEKTPQAEELHERLQQAADATVAAAAKVGTGAAGDSATAGGELDANADEAATIARGAASLTALEAYLALAAEAWGVQEQFEADAALTRAMPVPVPAPMPEAPPEEVPVAPEPTEPPPAPEPEPQPEEPPAPPEIQDEPQADAGG